MDVTEQLAPRLERYLQQALFLFLILLVATLTFSIAVSSITFALAIMVGLALVFLSKRRLLQPTPLDYFFLAYVCAELLSTAFSVEPLSSLVNAKRLFLIAVVYLTLVSLDTREKYTWAVGIVVGTSVVLSIIEIIPVAEAVDPMRLGMFQYPMTTGGMKMIVLLLLLPLVIDKATPVKTRILSIVGFVPLFIALVLTQTRSSWLGFIAGGITIGLAKSKSILIGIVVLVLIALFLAPHDIQSRVGSIVDPNHPSNLTRIRMVTTGLRMFLDYPVVGTGDIDLRKLYETYIVPIESAEGGHLHNNYVMLLVTLGAVGFVVVMTLFVRIFLVEWKTARRTKLDWLYGSIALGCLAVYVGFLVSGLFEWNFGDHEIAVSLWFTVGLSLVSRKLFETNQNEDAA